MDRFWIGFVVATVVYAMWEHTLASIRGYINGVNCTKKWYKKYRFFK